jgi:hypothetical protein
MNVSESRGIFFHSYSSYFNKQSNSMRKIKKFLLHSQSYVEKNRGTILKT